MTRKEVLAIALIVIVVLFMSFLATALMVLWLPTILIRPAIAKSAGDAMKQRIVRQVVKGMMFA